MLVMDFIENVNTNMNIIQLSVFQLEPNRPRYDSQCRGNECTHEGTTLSLYHIIIIDNINVTY